MGISDEQMLRVAAFDTGNRRFAEIADRLKTMEDQITCYQREVEELKGRLERIGEALKVLRGNAKV